MQHGSEPESLKTAAVFALEQDWSYKVTVLADLVARRVTSVVQRVSGLNLSQWRVLAAIADKPGRTASDVVDVTPMDKAIVSRAVASLVERDLLRRTASQNDGRSSHLQLTDNGYTLYNEIVSEMRKTGVDGLDALNKSEENQFLKQLDQVIKAYRESVDTKDAPSGIGG